MTNNTGDKNIILIVEDDEGLSELIRETLFELKKEFLRINKGNDLISYLKEHSPALLLLDYSLSDMKGDELISYLEKNHISIPPFIVMTGMGDERIAVNMMKSGARDYLVKDIQFLDILPSVIKRVLRESEMEYELRKVQESLKETEKKYQEIYNSTNDVIFIHNLDGKILEVNERFVTLYGYCMEDAMNITISDISGGIHPYTEDEALKKLRKTVTDGPQIFEWKCKRKNGEIFWAEVSLRCANIGGEKRVISAVRDISERKKAEEDLMESEERLRTLINVMPDIVCFKDGEGRWLEANEFDLNLFQLKGVDYKGKKDSELADYSPFYRDAFLACEDSDEVAWKAKGYSRGVEVIPVPEGNTRTFDIIKIPTFHSDGKRKGLVVVGRDISEIKKAEEERLKIETQMLHAQKLESLGVLAGGIAHDFNNLLMAILGHGDLALMEISPLSPIYENIENIIKVTKRAADLTKQMLAYSGKGTFHIKPIDLTSLVEEMIHMIEISISKKAILKLNLDRNLPLMEADVSQIRQITMNLIINASESMGDKNGVISISTGVKECDKNYLDKTYLTEKRSEGTYIYLEISDTGHGMDEETVKKIFDPFFTTKFTGRGLGLAAVLGIVKGHKGAIMVDSKVEQGTTFTILFPISKDIPVKPLKNTYTQHAWKGSGTILLVDDEADILKVTGQYIKRLGFDVLTAANGFEALKSLRLNKDAIVCILLDLTMPYMNGEEAFREIRKISPGIPVIIFSGYSEQEISDRFDREDIAGFIQKPYDLLSLKNKLKEILG